MRLFGLLVGMILVGGAALPAAQGVTVDLTAASQGLGSKGATWRPTGADFVVTARWGMLADGTNDVSKNPSNTAGLAYQDESGLGVWADAYKLVKGKKGQPDEWVLAPGSDGISGGGPHGYEELIFTFDSPVVLDAVLVGLVDIEFGRQDRPDKDDPVFFISLDGANEITVPESSLLAAFTSTGAKAGCVDFSALTDAAFGDGAELWYFRARSVKGHYEVGFVTYERPAPGGPPPIPEPASMALLALGAVGIVGRAMRRR